ncbi:MAG: YvcK family protein, partial [Acidobacteriota bacterium]
KLRKDLLHNAARLQEDFLIAIGESLLGRYIKKRHWIEKDGYRCYEIKLAPIDERECCFSDSQLRTYLSLARMIEDPSDDGVFRITLNRDEGFLPPGLLFGLVYAWYLSGKGFTMEYEMTLLRWSQKSLIPMHAKERVRKEALVAFFRKEVFGHRP